MRRKRLLPDSNADQVAFLRFEPLERRDYLSAAPTISAVFIGSSEQEFAYRVPGGDQQLASLPWSTLDQISVEFSQAVAPKQEHFSIDGIQSGALDVVDFRYDTATKIATWTLEEVLKSDKYAIYLTDDTVDESGNRLDGEWWDGKSTSSGNGVSGGDFRFAMSVLVGDVDQDQETSIRDRSLTAQAVDTAFADRRLDVDLDGQVTSNDLIPIAESYGDLEALGGHDRHIETVEITSPDGEPSKLAVLNSQTEPTVSLVDVEGVTASRVQLNSSFRFLDIEPLPGENGHRGVAILGIHRQTGGTRVWLWDFTDGSISDSIPFGKLFGTLDLEVAFIESELTVAVMGQRTVRETRVWLAPIYGLRVRNSIGFGPGFDGFDLEIADQSSSVSSRLLVGGVYAVTQGVRVKVKDVATRTQLANVSYGRVTPVDLEVFSAGDKLSLALLIESAGRNGARVDVRSLSGERLDLVSFETQDRPLELNGLRSAGQTQFFVTTENAEHFYSSVMISPVDSAAPIDSDVTFDIAAPTWMSFGSGSRTSDSTLLTLGSGEVAMAVAQYNPLTDTEQVKIRSATNGGRIRNIPLNGARENPSWYESNRVHGHTRLSMVDPRLGLGRSYFQTVESENAATFFSELGASVFTRHAVTMDEDPWWPSELPVNDLGERELSFARDNQGIALTAGRNLVQEFTNEAWSVGLPMMAYYFDAADARHADLNAEWVCSYPDGTTASHVYKGELLDITGPYGDVVLQRLLELADMGVGGIYLDFRHLPVNGCWGTQLEQDYFAETGETTTPQIGNNPNYVDFIQFVARRLEQTISNWGERIHEEYPSLPLVVSVTSVPALTRLDMSTELLSVGNPKSEFEIATRRGQSNSVFRNNPELYEPPKDVRMALGWALLRDASQQGDIPHIWNAFTPNEEHLLGFVSAVTAYGSIAALDVAEELLVPDGAVEGVVSRDDIEAGFSLGRQVSAQLSGTTATRWAAVLFSENSRNARGLDTRTAWEDVLLPTVGAFQAVQRSHWSVSVINDRQLTDGLDDDYQVLLVPNPTELTSEQRRSVADFVAQGGRVVENQSTWDWTTEAGYNSAVEEVQQQLLNASLRPPVEVLGLPEFAHSTSYQRSGTDGTDRIVVAVVNDFTFVQSSTIFDPIAEGDVQPAPADIPAGVRIVIQWDSHFSELDPHALVAFDAISESFLPVTFHDNQIEVVLPSVEQMALVVLESVTGAWQNAISIPTRLPLEREPSSSVESSAVSCHEQDDLDQCHALAPPSQFKDEVVKATLSKRFTTARRIGQQSIVSETRGLTLFEQSFHSPLRFWAAINQRR